MRRFGIRTASAPAVLGVILATAYAVLALAATARSTVQIATRFATAPLPYVLSAAAAAAYLALAILFRRRSDVARRAAVAACMLELAGVLTVGTWSVLQPAAFPDQTVWSLFGAGYGFVPLVLPALGLWWLRTYPGRPVAEFTDRAAG